MITYFYDKIKNSLTEMYEESIKELDLTHVSCPCCGARGFFKDHGGYSRHVVALLHDQLIHELLIVQRVKCVSCKHTHALLPSFIIPYNTHAYSIILKCLEEKVISKSTVMEICEKYEISFQLLYEWIKRFKGHQIQCCHVFEQGLLAFKDVLVKILNEFPLFINRFFKENKVMFMQTMRSP
jgi:transposase-like protein